MKDLLTVSVISVLVIITILFVLKKRGEKFDIPVCTSTAWGWNTGPGYGAGYGTGYGLYGVWPSRIPTRPWKYWMWGRRPSQFLDRETPAPQIDYGVVRY